jgi:hypothetical protein
MPRKRQVAKLYWADGCLRCRRWRTYRRLYEEAEKAEAAADNWLRASLKIYPVMSAPTDSLPDDPGTLKAMLLAEMISRGVCRRWRKKNGQRKEFLSAGPNATSVASGHGSIVLVKVVTGESESFIGPTAASFAGDALG